MDGDGANTELILENKNRQRVVAGELLNLEFKVPRLVTVTGVVRTSDDHRPVEGARRSIGNLDSPMRRVTEWYWAVTDQPAIGAKPPVYTQLNVLKCDDPTALLLQLPQ